MTGDFADLVIYYGSAAGPKTTPWLLAELTRHLPHGRIPLTWVAAFSDHRIGEVQNRLVEELEGEVLGRGLHPDELTYIEYLPEECPAALCRAPDRNGTVVVAVVHGPEGGEP